jgi:WD40 repeat protein
LGNKNVTCYEFLYKQPVIALGGSDGNIRFWNYSKKKVTQDKVDVHTKSVVKIVVIHVCFILFLLKKLQRSSIISSQPSMLSCSVDGSISCYNLENKVSEFKILKAHGKGNPSIIDMIYDPNSETITTIGSDKSVYIRESKSGNVISNYKISEKVQLKSISMIKTCNYIPDWYILTGHTTKLYMIDSKLSDECFDKYFDILYHMNVKGTLNKLKAKIYNLCIHPLKRNLFFFGRVVILMQMVLLFVYCPLTHTIINSVLNFFSLNPIEFLVVCMWCE